MVKLTVQWEEGMEPVGRKKEKYKELSAVSSQVGWRVFTYPVEIQCSGYTGTSTQQFLKSLGITGFKLRKALKDLAEEAELGSILLWLRRKNTAWGKHGS